MTQATPHLTMAQSGPARQSEGLWTVPFEIANHGDSPVSLAAAWLPHGRFNCPQRSLGGSAPLPPGGRTELTFPVAFHEEAGTVVENAFVIVRLSWREEAWRVLARLTVTAGPAGEPRAVTELVTAHPVGFAG